MQGPAYAFEAWPWGGVLGAYSVWKRPGQRHFADTIPITAPHTDAPRAPGPPVASAGSYSQAPRMNRTRSCSSLRFPEVLALFLVDF